MRTHGHPGPGHPGFGRPGPGRPGFPDVQVPGRPGFPDVQVPGHPGPRTSRFSGRPGFPDVQVPGHPGFPDVQVFQLNPASFRTSRFSNLILHLAASFSNEYFYLANSLPRNQTNAPIAILQKLSHAIWGEHLKTHSGENSNNCTNCNFPSFEGISLRRHMNMHNGGKPHKCNHCSYTNTRHAICESI